MKYFFMCVLPDLHPQLQGLIFVINYFFIAIILLKIITQEYFFALLYAL